MSRIRFIAAAAALATCAALGTATAAFAGETPTPTPTPTQFGGGEPTCLPTPFDGPQVQFGGDKCKHPRPVLRDWEWDLTQVDVPGDGLSLNNVIGVGAIPMNLWRDTQLTNNIDRFSRGVRSVTLWHDSIALADIDVNRYTCTVNIDQHRGRFFILSTTGLGPQLRSVNGQFDLQGELSWNLISRHRDGLVQVCPLRFLGDGQILRAILSSNGGGLPQPSMDDFAVQGRAQVFAIGRPIPHPFSPTVTPTDTVTPSPLES